MGAMKRNGRVTSDDDQELPQQKSLRVQPVGRLLNAHLRAATVAPRLAAVNHPAQLSEAACVTTCSFAPPLHQCSTTAPPVLPRILIDCAPT